MLRRTLPLIVIALTGIVPASALGAAGDLDTTFGGTGGPGKATRAVGGAGNVDSAGNDIAVIGAGGKLVMAGAANAGGGEVPTLWGLTADGHTDSDFGPDDNGLTILADRPAPAAFTAVKVQPSTGRIIAVGYQGDGGTGSDGLVAAFEPDGDPDPTFNALDTPGYEVLDTGTGDAKLLDLDFDDSGRIVVAGAYDADPSTLAGRGFLAARFTPSGVRDTSGFHSPDGYHLIANREGANFGEGRAIVAQDDGIAIAGFEWEDADHTHFRIDKLTDAGALDAPWGNTSPTNDGHFRAVPGTHGGFEAFDALTEDAGGRLIGAGAYSAAGPQRWAIARLSADGSMATFNTSLGVTGQIRDLVRSGNHIYAAGDAGDNFGLARFAVPSGDDILTFDPTYHGGTVQTTEFGSTDVPKGIALQDGRPVLGGTGSAAPKKFAAARYQTTAAGGPVVPTISVADAQVTEGNVAADGRHAELTVSLSQPTTVPVEFRYSTAHGTAGASDYEALTNFGPVAFAPGVTSQKIPVAITEDTAFENDETFTVILDHLQHATPGRMSGTATIRNDDAAPTTGGGGTPALPPAVVAETPNPTWYVKAGLSQRAAQLLVNQGVRTESVVRIADNPRRVAFDWMPYLKDQKPGGGYFDPTKKAARQEYVKTGPVRFWTITQVNDEVNRLNAGGIPVVVTYRAFDRPKYGNHLTKPGDVIGMDPLPRNQQLSTTFANPVTVQVNYHFPAPPPPPKKEKPPTRGACEDLYDELGGASANAVAATREFEQMLERHKARGCGVRVQDFTDRRYTFPAYSAPLISSDKKFIDLKKFLPKLPTLVMTVHSAGSSENPSFDQNWRLTAGLGSLHKNKFGLVVTDLGTRMPLANVRLQYWLDVKGAGGTKSTLLDEGVTASDGTTDVRLDIPSEGTLRVEALGTPKSGQALFGWMEIPVVSPGDCIRGISGWNWDSRGFRTDAGKCAGGAARAAAFSNGWDQLMCTLFCGLIPSLKPQLEAKADAAKKARGVESKPASVQGGTARVAQGQTALGSKLIPDPKAATTEVANVISTGGGNVISTGGGNVISTGGGNVISTGGGNVISTGGGNVISTGGGNVISTGGGNFTGQSANVINLARGPIASGVISTGGGNAIDISKSATQMIGASPVISTGGGNLISDKGLG